MVIKLHGISDPILKKSGQLLQYNAKNLSWSTKGTLYIKPIFDINRMIEV